MAGGGALAADLTVLVNPLADRHGFARCHGPGQRAKAEVARVGAGTFGI